jgi:cbb3-type cytochrome c oxidase subunit III
MSGIILSKTTKFHPQISLWWVMVIAALVLGGCTTDQNAKLSTEQQELREGRELFSRSCTSCHGTRGSGSGTRSGPALNSSDYRYGHTREAVLESIRDGRAQGMPAFSSVYSKAQLEALTEYVLYLQK